MLLYATLNNFLEFLNFTNFCINSFLKVVTLINAHSGKGFRLHFKSNCYKYFYDKKQLYFLIYFLINLCENITEGHPFYFKIEAIFKLGIGVVSF